VGDQRIAEFTIPKYSFVESNFGSELQSGAECVELESSKKSKGCGVVPQVFMDSSIIVALIGAFATIVTAVITAVVQKNRSKDENGMPMKGKGKSRQKKSREAKEESAAPPKSEGQEETSSVEEVEEYAALGSGDEGLKEYVKVPCPNCSRCLGVLPRMWFKRIRCKKCRALLKLSPIPGTSVVLLGPGKIDDKTAGFTTL
jgi:hypothetical protein